MTIKLLKQAEKVKYLKLKYGLFPDMTISDIQNNRLNQQSNSPLFDVAIYFL